MRNTFLLFIIIVLISSCRNKKEGNQTDNSEGKVSKLMSEFRITKDTLDYTIDGHLNKVVFFKNKFYCMFRMDKGNTSHSFKKMVVLNKTGEFIEDIIVPDGIETMIYYDFKLENDSLYVKREQFDEENFLLDEYTNSFKKVTNRQFKIYEDKEYIAYSTCCGEFGGTIFFQDNETNLRYEGSATCPIIINKIGTEYYITNYLDHEGGTASVLKIADPRNLEFSYWDFKNEIGSQTNKGIEKVFESMNFYISTSFVHKQKLLHIYSDWRKTYIGRIEDEEMKMIYEFDFSFYSQFNHLTDDGKQILNFLTPDNKEKGILIIEENNLKFKFLK